MPINTFAAEKIIFVDMRILMSAHPLFEVFDRHTNRFKGTSSEFIPGGWEGVDAYIEEIKKKQDELLKTPEKLKKKLKNTPLSDRMKLEREILQSKKKAEDELQTMKMRVHMAQQFPDVMGHTLDTAIAPQVNQMNSDMRAVIVELKKKYKANTVMDLTDLLPLEKKTEKRTSLLIKNMPWLIYNEPKKVDEKEFLSWLNEGADYWANEWGVDAPVIPYGAEDVRLESLKMLEERVRGIIK